jgi:hypothetical protein
VVLVVSGGTVSQAAITRAARLAAGTPVTVIGVGSGFLAGTDRAVSAASAASGRLGSPACPAHSPNAAETEPEKVRRAVAQAMTALENTGVMAHGHIAVTGSPARAVARVVRARGARVVVLDERGPADPARHPGAPPRLTAGNPGRPGPGALAAELRRRMYGSGVIVLSATDPAGPRPFPS